MRLEGKKRIIDDFWEQLSSSTLYLDETDSLLKIDRDQVERFYQPLAMYLITKIASHQRLMVGVAGPPGCGKTAFAMLLSEVIKAVNDEDISVVVGLDGWHFPNAYLATHFIERNGTRVPLKAIKGAPETLNFKAALVCLKAIQKGGEISFPVYNRNLHEPVPESGRVSNTHKIVIVEGNFLLLDEFPWDQFRDLFDIRIFINAGSEVIEPALIERHRRGGKAPESIQQHMFEVDLPNARRVLSNFSRADVIVYKKDPIYIDYIKYV